ncbi:hypothetical protein C7S18_24000 (plasmid) [Ahniella affigens]|uniref:Uncharacterized protein n=1 Tax=Ahniella affigens TaxID=2021234 RepID=A0A2P1PZX5_9GAMM|nr:hypothetical protein [Ahniella affigens]AVQ00365.1 hypothetical protein C7S18_24000 [Ahniella affigens]
METYDLFGDSPEQFVKRFAKRVRRIAKETMQKGRKAKQLDLKLRLNRYPKRMAAETGGSEWTPAEVSKVIPEMLVRQIELMLDRTFSERLEIENWVFNPDPADPRSFDVYCEFVGIDPDRFRSGLRRCVARTRKIPQNILRIAS